MEPFKTLTGIVAPLDMPNVDTDQIIPKQFLKRIERTGFGPFLFYDWRYIDGKALNPQFEMNAPRYQGATILLTRANFGSGSSREHAPWALHDYGIRCLIAPSFADIFYNNCFKNGMLPICLPSETIEMLFQKLRAHEGFQLTIDLPDQQVRTQDGQLFSFNLNPHLRHNLLNGLDDISQTLQYEDKIRQYEGGTEKSRSCLFTNT